MKSSRQTTDLKTAQILPTYAATLRRLRAIVFSGDDADQKEKVFWQSVETHVGERSTKLTSLQAAYYLFRISLEHIPIARQDQRSYDFKIDEFTILTRPISRLELRAWLLAVFATLYYHAQLHPEISFKDLLNLPGMPGRFIGSEITEKGTFISGTVFMPHIVGLPLWPFARNGKPIDHLTE